MDVLGTERAVRVAGGRRVSFHEFGDRDGFAVVYFHGGLSSGLDAAFADAAARRRGVRLLAPDRPGIGTSFASMPRTVADVAADVSSLCDQLGIATFSVMGWSAGGPFALACAARLGERVARVATVGGMAPLRDPLSVRQLGLLADRFLYPASRRAPRLAQLALATSITGSDVALQRRLVRSLPSSADKRVVGAMTPEVAARPWRAAVAKGSRGLVDDYAVTGAPWGFGLHEVRRPATVFQGVEDTLVPMVHAQALVARLGAAELVVVPDAGHFVFHAATDEVLASLVA